MARKIVVDFADVIKLESHEDSGRLWLTAPYNAKANDFYKSIAGRWQPTSKTWVFVHAPLIVVSLQSFCKETWGFEPEVKELKTPYPDDTPIKGKGHKWMRPPEEVAVTEPTIFFADKRAAVASVQALVAYLPQLTNEEKEEVLKPLFDAL